MGAHNTCFEIRAIGGGRYGLFNSTTGEAVLLNGSHITGASADAVRQAALLVPEIDAAGVATTRTAQSFINEAAELGIGIQSLDTHGNVARIRISQNFTNATADFTQFGQSLRLQGVNLVVVDTGPVVAEQLSARYRQLAASGGTVRGGGRIRLVSETPSSIPGRHGELIPSFEIVYEIR